MLIWRVSDWRVESDGYICANDLALLQDLPALQRVNAQRARQEAADLAQRARRVRRQALARGFIAGRAAAVHDLAMPAAAAAFALRGLNDRLVKIVVEAVRDVVGDMPAGAIFPNQLRRSLQAAPGQRPLSVRVSACDYEEARQAVSAMEDELGLTLITVLGDADLPPRSCVVETDIGVIDGSLRQQLAALERGIRDAIATVLDEYTRLDDRLLRQFDVIEQGLRDTLDVLSRDATPAGWIACNATNGGAAI